MTGDLRITLGVAVCAFVLFLPFNRAHFSGSDEIAVYEMTRSLAERGRLDIPPLRHTEVGRGGLRYSYFSPGQSVLALPLWSLAGFARGVLPHAWVRALSSEPIRRGVAVHGGELEATFVGLFAPAASACLVALFFAFARQLGASLRSALIASALLSCSTYLLLMSTFFLRHVTETLALMAGLMSFHRFAETGRVGELWRGSALASCAPLVRVPAAIAGPALAGYLAWALLVRRPGAWSRALPAILVPLAVALAIHAAVDFAKWGSIASPMLGQSSRMGNPILVGLHGFLLSPGSSIFVYSPLLLLTPFTWPALYRRFSALALCIAGICASLLLFYSKFDGWEGLWSAPGPRYLFPATPLLMLPLSLWLDERSSPVRWLAVATLAAAGLYVQVVSTTLRWGYVPDLAGWMGLEPQWSFLFSFPASPIAQMSRLFFSGGPFDMWLLRLANGWPGHPGEPAAALVLLGLWAVALGSALAFVGRELRRARP